MLYLVGGFTILLGMLLLVWVFVNADPARLARGLRWTGILVAVAAIGIALVWRPAIVLVPLATLMPLLSRLRAVLDRYRPPPSGQSSTVATEYLRMTLDHDTGSMTGTVLRGRFAGMRLEEMTLSDLVLLLRECRAADDRGARLLEAYLDRAHADWRDELGGEAGGAHGGARAAGGAMSIDEAYAILGLSPGADTEAIKEAHHRLIMKLHPDHGGSDYLAMQINRARDVLLARA